MSKSTKKTKPALESIAQTIDGLAAATNEGFTEMQKEMKKNFQELDTRMQTGFATMGNDLKEVKEKLDNKVGNIEFMSLAHRVRIIENKLGIKAKR